MSKFGLSVILFFTIIVVRAQNVGIGTATPNNKLEITSGAPNTSGLRLTNLTSTSPTVSANGKSLSVDANGDVILTPSAADAWSILGNTGTTAGTNFLGTTDAQDLVFKTNNTEKMRVLNNGNVGIGTATPIYKLHVSNTDPSVQIGTYTIVNPIISANLAGNLHASWSTIAPNSTFNFNGNLYGAVNRINSLAGQTGSINGVLGATNDVSHSGSGNITNAVGSVNYVSNQASGIITNVKAGQFDVRNFGGGSITNAYGVYIGNVEGTNKWSLYASDANAPNYMAANLGIGTTNPNNKLEITSAAANTSGLRFTNLTSTSTTVAANGKSLSVDANGDVVLVPASTNGWSVLGNAGTVAGTNFLGTTDAQALSIRTNNLERIRVLNNGQVGIGTAVPNAGSLLDINGPTNVPGAGTLIYNDNAVTGTPSGDAFRMKYDNNILGVNQDGLVFEKTDANAVVPDGGIAFTNTGMSGTEILAMCIRGNGNVGVGTPNPITSLANTDLNIIASDGNGITMPSLTWAMNSNGYVGALYNEGTLFNSNGLAVKISGATATNRLLDLSVGALQNTAGTSRMTVLGNGNVGISAANPGSLLQIGNAMYFGDGGTAGNGAVGTDIRFNTDGIVSADKNLHINIDGLNATTNSYFSFRKDAYTTASAELMRVQENGFVGIGTTTPATKLHLLSALPEGIIVERNSNLNSVVEARNTIGSVFFGAASGTGDFAIDGDNDVSLLPWFSIDRTTGNVGINTTAATFKLQVLGTTACTGNVWTSDMRKKKNIQPLNLKGLDIINKLNPVTFEWKDIQDDGMKGTQIGFIAQELEKILPSMVVTENNADQSKGVKYNELLPILVKAIQEQQTLINEMDVKHQKQIDELNQKIEKLSEKK